MSDLESIDLKRGFGNLNIVGIENGKGELILRATGSIDDPAQFSEELRIPKNINSSNAGFQIIPAETSNISDQINLEATLTIPKRIKVTANTSGGHINASNMANNQHLRTLGGHISLHSLKGNTVAETDGGHITGDKIGKTSVATGGGHIEIQKAAGNISAKMSGGTISASVYQPDEALKFVTSAGNIKLGLPKDIPADLDISGSTVRLSDTFELEGIKSHGSISGSANGGGLPVVVRCEYGNVNINTIN